MLPSISKNIFIIEMADTKYADHLIEEISKYSKKIEKTRDKIHNLHKRLAANQKNLEKLTTERKQLIFDLEHPFKLHLNSHLADVATQLCLDYLPSWCPHHKLVFRGSACTKCIPRSMTFNCKYDFCEPVIFKTHDNDCPKSGVILIVSHQNDCELIEEWKKSLETGELGNYDQIDMQRCKCLTNSTDTFVYVQAKYDHYGNFCPIYKGLYFDSISVEEPENTQIQYCYSGRDDSGDVYPSKIAIKEP